MSRLGFLALAIPVALMGILGTGLVLHACAPEPAERHLSCEEWFAHPPAEQGRYAIDGCVVDASTATWWVYAPDDDPAEVAVPVYPSLDRIGEPAHLYWVTKDATILALTYRIRRDQHDAAALERTIDRYFDQVYATRPVVGREVTSGEMFELAGAHEQAGRGYRVIDGSPLRAGSNLEPSFGIALIFLALGILVPLVLAQRKWKRTERALRGDAMARPQTF